MTVLVIVGLVVLAVAIYKAMAPPRAREDCMSDAWLKERWLADARREPYDGDQELGG